LQQHALEYSTKRSNLRVHLSVMKHTEQLTIGPVDTSDFTRCTGARKMSVFGVALQSSALFNCSDQLFFVPNANAGSDLSFLLSLNSWYP